MCYLLILLCCFAAFCMISCTPWCELGNLGRNHHYSWSWAGNLLAKSIIIMMQIYGVTHSPLSRKRMRWRGWHYLLRIALMHCTNAWYIDVLYQIVLAHRYDVLMSFIDTMNYMIYQYCTDRMHWRDASIRCIDTIYCWHTLMSCIGTMH